MPLSQPDEPLTPVLATPSFAEPMPPHSNILVGPMGLRAGWGILLFFVISVLLGMALFTGLFKSTGRLQSFQQDSEQSRQAVQRAKAAHQPVPQPAMRLSYTFLSETAEASAVILTALGISFIERRRFKVYGLGLRHIRDVIPGALSGLVAMAVMIGMLRSLHLLVFDRRLLHGAAAARFGTEWLLVFLLVGVFEEFFFRGYVQYTLTRGLLGLGRRISPGQAQRAAFWITAVLLSLVFFLAHTTNAGENPAGLAAVFLAGILFSYALWRTGSLWWGIGAHMTWDWAQSFLFGVPDSGTLSLGRLFQTHAVGNPLLSGGIDGPEGSLLLLPAFLLLALAIRLHPQAEQPALAPESLPFVSSAAVPESVT